MDENSDNEQNALYIPGNSLRQCNEHDLTRKGSKANKFQLLTILPAHLGVKKGFEGKVGNLVDINTPVPKFVVDTSNGQIVFDGRVVRSSTSFFAVDCASSSTHSQISDLFRDVLVFGEPRFVPKSKDVVMSIDMDATAADESVQASARDAENVSSSHSSSPRSAEKHKGREVIFTHGISQLGDKFLRKKSRSQLSQLSQMSSSSQTMGHGNREEEDDESEFDSDADDDNDDVDVQSLPMWSDSEGSVAEARRSARKTKRPNYAEVAGGNEHEEEEEWGEEDSHHASADEGNVSKEEGRGTGEEGNLSKDESRGTEEVARSSAQTGGDRVPGGKVRSTMTKRVLESSDSEPDKVGTDSDSDSYFDTGSSTLKRRPLSSIQKGNRGKKTMAKESAKKTSLQKEKLNQQKPSPKRKSIGSPKRK